MLCEPITLYLSIFQQNILKWFLNLITSKEMGWRVHETAVQYITMLPLWISSECILYLTWCKYFKPHLTVLHKYLVFLAFKSEQCYHTSNFYKKVQKRERLIWVGMISWEENETNLPKSFRLESILKKKAYSRTIILKEGSGKSLLLVCF